MRILITGVHGFVGTNLACSLTGHKVYGVDIVSPQNDNVLETFSWEDVAQNRIPKVDAIIHLAGKAHDVNHQLVWDDFYSVNTVLTQKIFDYYKASSSRIFIFFSSVAAVAKHVDTILLESEKEAPNGFYGKSKYLAEQYICSNWDDLDLNKRVYILRPSMIHGPGNKGNLNLLYGVVKKGIPYPLGAFDNKRSFTSVDNLKFIINRLLESDAESGIYNVADDEPVSSNELVALIAEILGNKSRIWNVPQPIVRGMARLCDWLHLPLTTERLEKLTGNFIVSNQKIKNAIGVENLPVRAHDGLVKTIKSMIRK